MELFPLVSGALPRLRDRRRALHRIPEEGFEEHQTQRYVMETLKSFAPDQLHAIGGTGVRAVFQGDGTGRRIAFRSDMDALPIAEQNTHDYGSAHPGKMHACGHDGHMSVLLTLAEMLSAQHGHLRDTVTLLFQPAEESVGGAKPLIEAGALRNPDVEAVYGLHMMPDLPIGVLGTAIGPLMAGTCEFDISLQGRAAHGAIPQEGLDAVVAAAELVQSLQGMLTRSLDPYRPAVLTVGRLSAGDRRNIIADHATLECTMRAFDDETLEHMRRGIASRLRGLRESLGVEGRYDELVVYPPVVNDEAETRRVMAALGGDLRLVPPKMIAEDFSFYQREVPGVFLFLGCMDDTHRQPLHSPLFDFDEAALCYGLQSFLTLISFDRDLRAIHPHE